MILIIIALLLPTMLGFLILSLLLRNESDTGLLERLCLSYPLGMGLQAFQMFFLGLLRIPLTLTYTSLPLIIEIVGLFLWIGINKIPLSPKPSFGFYEEITSQNTKLMKKVLLSLLMLWVVAKIISVFYLTLLRPIWAWDAWSNWSASAKVFFYSNSLMLDSPIEEFFGRNIVSRIPAYPLHNHMLQVWLGLWSGSFDEILVKFWSPMYLLAAAAYLYLFISKEVNRVAALGMLTIFMGSQFNSYHAAEVYSDATLSTFILFALTSFLKSMRGGAGYWPITGLFSAEALFIKEESLFFVSPLILSVIVYIWNRSNRFSTHKKELASFLIPFILIIPWYIFRLHNSVGFSSIQFVNPRLDFHPDVIWQSLVSIAKLENFNVIFIFFPALVLFSGKPSREFLHLLFAIFCYSAFFIALYGLTTYNFYFHQGTTFYRNTLTYYSSLFFLSSLLLKNIISNNYFSR